MVIGAYSISAYILFVPIGLVAIIGYFISGY